MTGQENRMIKIRTVTGPFGPHSAKKEFLYKGKWNFLKWMPKTHNGVNKNENNRRNPNQSEQRND